MKEHFSIIADITVLRRQLERIWDCEYSLFPPKWFFAQRRMSVHHCSGGFGESV